MAILFSARRAWRSKTAQALLDATSTKDIVEAVIRSVELVRKRALKEGLEKGVKNRPYDPNPLAMVLGASEVRNASIGIDGHIIANNSALIVEYDSDTQSPHRRRFTVAHEVGHLILWQATGRIRKLPTRATTKGSEIEELCDMIACEILAPLRELEDYRRTARIRESPIRNVDLIVELAREYNVSLQFAAMRFRQVTGMQIGIGLLNLSRKEFEWHSLIRDPRQLLTVFSGGIGKCSSTKSGSYTVYLDYGIKVISFESIQIGSNYHLIVTLR